MQYVEPSVHLVASTSIHPDAFQDALAEVGAPEWHTDSMSDAGELAEFAGRLCYRSFEPGLNPNVKRIRQGNSVYIENILKQGHGSVLEHGSVSFLFHNVSRVFTHELIRHRHGTPSQESLRYVRLDELRAFFPDDGFGEQTLRQLWDSFPAETQNELTSFYGSVDGFVGIVGEHLQAEFQDTFIEAENRLVKITRLLHLDDCANFEIKKLITSAMRRLAPEGLATAILYTTNHRALRNIIEQRTSRHAEEEIRLVFAKVWEQLSHQFPVLYQDADVAIYRGKPEITFRNRRV